MAVKNVAAPLPLAPIVRPETVPAVLLQKLAATPGWELSFADLLAALSHKRDPRTQLRHALERMESRRLVTLSWSHDPRHPCAESETEKKVRMTATGEAALKENVEGAQIAQQRKPTKGQSKAPPPPPTVVTTGHTYRNQLPACWSAGAKLPPPTRQGADDHQAHPSRIGQRRESYTGHP